MFTRLGAPEILVILGVGLLLFGPKKLPELGKSFGETIKQFKSAASEINTEKEETDKEETVDKA